MQIHSPEFLVGEFVARNDAAASALFHVPYTYIRICTTRTSREDNCVKQTEHPVKRTHINCTDAQDQKHTAIVGVSGATRAGS